MALGGLFCLGIIEGAGDEDMDVSIIGEARRWDIYTSVQFQSVLFSGWYTSGSYSRVVAVNVGMKGRGLVGCLICKKILSQGGYLTITVVLFPILKYTHLSRVLAGGKFLYHDVRSLLAVCSQLKQILITRPSASHHERHTNYQYIPPTISKGISRYVYKNARALKEKERKRRTRIAEMKVQRIISFLGRSPLSQHSVPKTSPPFSPHQPTNLLNCSTHDAEARSATGFPVSSPWCSRCCRPPGRAAPQPP